MKPRLAFTITSQAMKRGDRKLDTRGQFPVSPSKAILSIKLLVSEL
jgi:hypothetical protein